MVLNQKKILCRVDDSGPIPELHFITGPVRKCRVSEDVLYRMVRNGRIIYELDPEGKKDPVRLNIMNMTTRVFAKQETVKAVFVKTQNHADENETPVVDVADENTTDETTDEVSETENVVEQVIPEKPQYQNNKNFGKNNKHSKNKYNEVVPTTPDI
ncbi:MAG TPA: hypothetical protein DCW90_00940 [Lachnospiraceae bacterium]|nr:hypothetical protein [Lachnospiraceae bacterium]